MLWLLRRKKTQQAKLDALSKQLNVHKTDILCAGVEIIYSLVQAGLLKFDDEAIKTDPTKGYEEILRSIKNEIENQFPTRRTTE